MLGPAATLSGTDDQTKSYGTLKARLDRGADALEAALSDWRELVAGTETSSFEHPDWLYRWWRHFAAQHEPWILRIGEPASAILGLFLHRGWRRRHLRPLGHGLSDYQGAAPTPWQPDAAAAMGDALANASNEFDLLTFDSLRAPDATRTTFARSIGRPFAERPYERCPYIRTEGTWTAYLASRKRKFRANLKRTERRAAHKGSPLVAIERATPSLFDEMLEVEKRSWKWRTGSAYLQDRRRRAFLWDILSPGAVPHEIWTCRVEGQLGSFAVVLLGSSTRYYYLPSYRADLSDLGTYLLASIVRDSFETSIRVFDFLRGDESYKLAWATGEQQVHQLAIAGKGALGRLALMTTRARWQAARHRRLRNLRQRLLQRLRHARPTDSD